MINGGSAVLEVDEATFEAEVVERSRNTPVVVDFWAEWCAPCRALGPVLERLAGEANGEWVLAKVDVDSNPDLARRYQVYGIPAVKAFRDGEVAAEFTGALPEDQVRAWLQGLGPSKADLFVGEARRAEEDGDLEGAAEVYRRALGENPAHPGARSGLSRVELSLRLGSLDADALEARVSADPTDLEALFGLADARFGEDRVEEAFEILLEIIRSTDSDARDRARRRLLQLIEVLPAGDPRVVQGRRSLASALY